MFIYSFNIEWIDLKSKKKDEISKLFLMEQVLCLSTNASWYGI